MTAFCDHVETAPGVWTCPTCKHVAKTSRKPRNRTCGVKPKSPPGLFRKAANLGRAVVATAADGFVKASPELVTARLAVCQSCDRFDRQQNTCLECGCQLKFKPLMRAWDCPLGKWPRPDTVQSSLPSPGATGYASAPPRVNVSPLASPRRHLIYHVWPSNLSDAWRFNVHELLQRIDQFDGTRSIAIATGPGAATAEEVQTAFAGVRIDNWIIVPNDPKLGEVASFSKLLATLPRDGITFYAHAKGTSYTPGSERHHVALLWAQMMYRVLLDGAKDVTPVLDRYPVAGMLKRLGKAHWRQKVGWHYTGNFWWIRNDRIPDAPAIRPDYYGVEAWPGETFHPDDMANVFGAGDDDLYDPGSVTRWSVQADKWLTRRKWTLDDVSIITTCKGRLDHLEQSLPAMLAQGTREVIAVDYGCPDGTADWAESQLAPIPCATGSASASPLRVIAVTRDTDTFNPARARNIACRQATGDLFVMLDADMIPPAGFVQNLLDQMNANGWHVCNPTTTIKGTGHLGEFGAAGITREAWATVNGYDEAFGSGYGFEDIDFYERAIRAGFARVRWSSHGLVEIQHSDAMRGQHFPQQDLRKSKQVNLTRMRDHARQVNPDGFGLM